MGINTATIEVLLIIIAIALMRSCHHIGTIADSMVN